MTTWAYQPLTPGAAALLQPAAGGDDALIQSTSVTIPPSGRVAPRVIFRTLIAAQRPTPPPQGTDAPIQSSISVVPVARAKPRVSIYSHRQRHAAAVVVERVTDRSFVSQPPRRAPVPTTRIQLHRTRLDNESQQRTFGTRHYVVLRVPTPAPAPRVEIVLRRQRLDTEATERTPPIRRIRFGNVPRSLPTPRVEIVLHRTRLDNLFIERIIPHRLLVPARPPVAAPHITIRALRQRLDNEATQRTFGTRHSNVIAVPRALPAPRTTIRAHRQRLDNESSQRTFAIRRPLTIRVPSLVTAPRVRIHIPSPAARFVAPVVERFRNRATLVSIPRALPKPRGLWSGTIQEGDRVERPRFINSIFVVPARPPVRAPLRPLMWRIHQETPGSAVAPTLVVGPTQVPGAPDVRQARPIWRSFVPPTPDRAADRILVVRVPQGLSAPRTTIWLRRARLDTAAVERRVVSRLLAHVPGTYGSTGSTFCLLRQRHDTERTERTFAIRRPLTTRVPIGRARARTFIEQVPGQLMTTALDATGAWGWAWDFDGDATQELGVVPERQSSVIGFNENVGRPKQTVGG